MHRLGIGGGLSADTNALPLTAGKVTRRPHADRVEQGNEDCLNSAYFGGGGLGGMCNCEWAVLGG